MMVRHDGLQTDHDLITSDKMTNCGLHHQGGVEKPVCKFGMGSRGKSTRNQVTQGERTTARVYIYYEMDKKN